MLHLTKAQLAEKPNYSVQYMLQTFQALYQTTPRRLLTIYRIICAKQLQLEQPAHSLLLLAYLPGFNSETYKLRAFKRQEN